MKKFSFRLQSILDIKQQLEEQAKSEFGAARARLLEEEEKLDRIRRQILCVTDDLRQLVSSSLNVTKIKQCRETLEIWGEKAQEQELVVKRASARAELARKKLNDAMLERKTIEKLREKTWEKYLREFEADEQKQTDMRVSYTYSGRLKDVQD